MVNVGQRGRVVTPLRVFIVVLLLVGGLVTGRLQDAVYWLVNVAGEPGITSGGGDPPSTDDDTGERLRRLRLTVIERPGNNGVIVTYTHRRAYGPYEAHNGFWVKVITTRHGEPVELIGQQRSPLPLTECMIEDVDTGERVAHDERDGTGPVTCRA